MREKLQVCDGVRATFQGTFKRFGRKPGWRGRELQTILLVNLTNERGDAICDHLWLNLTAAFAGLDLQPGERVRFDARVHSYEKGYRGRDDDYYDLTTDYGLARPTHPRRISPQPIETLPLFHSEHAQQLSLL